MKALVALSTFTICSIMFGANICFAESGVVQKLPATKAQRPVHTTDWLKDKLAQINASIEKDKSNPQLFAGKAQIFLELKDYGQAISEINKAISLNSSNQDYYFFRSLCEGSTNQNKKAIADLDHAIQLDPNRAPFYFHRGTLLHIEKKFAAAALDARKANDLRPKHYATLVLIAASENALEHYQAAVDWYTKAIAIEPQNGNTYILRSGVYKLLGKNDLAQSDQDQGRRLGANL